MESYLKSIYQKLNNPNIESLKLSLTDVHAKGLFSLVFSGTEFGKLTRAFIAEKRLKPFTVQYHTHRYPIKITAIKGNITHHTAIVHHSSESRTQSLKIDCFDYLSPLNGGKGLSFDKEVEISCYEAKLPIGSSIFLDVDDFHTVSCAKGSIWIVEELGFKKQSSKVLGVPFVTESLYNKPRMFQINDNVQLLKNKIKEITSAYSLVSDSM